VEGRLYPEFRAACFWNKDGLCPDVDDGAMCFREFSFGVRPARTSEDLPQPVLSRFIRFSSLITEVGLNPSLLSISPIGIRCQR
jgi:hypothetical protein